MPKKKLFIFENVYLFKFSVPLSFLFNSFSSAFPFAKQIGEHGKQFESSSVICVPFNPFVFAGHLCFQ
ncbi:hypothetical protein CMV_018345 [Castanea mollissima]|uniref:Uncharacterized protein n=1 Tax=Castanea mollissima TaxID=60419 RepID=A0A8J4VG93_9ROSI|nr:hypothetical protein CMV_018345 [Castanea mollissima]